MPALYLPETVRELLNQADVAFLNGSWTKGSWLLWEAYADAIQGISNSLGMPCENDDDIRQVLQRLAIPDLDYHSLVSGFYLARRFHDLASGEGPEDYEVECLYPEVRFVVAELVALA